MSLLNVYMERDRALVAFDTLAGSMTGAGHDVGTVANVVEALERLAAGMHTSKCGFLPHINAVMASRGDAAFAGLALYCLQQSMPQTFDEAVRHMPALLGHTHAQVTALRKQHMGVDDFPGAEIVLVGWSPILKRMEGVRWVRWPHDKGFNASPVRSPLLLPSEAWEQQPEAPDTPEKMEAIARDQVAYVRREHHGLQCGGRLMLAELTRDTLSVRTVCDLEVTADESPELAEGQ
ncbi:hypothetical protein [Frateuria soli]|uniref:hypothetical protein n=1 Tax=Frateuria soli TaxID=1542730 RepID=UPI001E396A1C|nr:hypothetical protein [Frateuria soli]UGB39129.1 hypothetical protein LQ771_04595 [Frateuria soli]